MKSTIDKKTAKSIAKTVDKVSDNPNKTGLLGFILKSAAAAVLIPPLFALAGFFIFVPYLNLAGAVLIVPISCALLFRLFSKKLRAEPLAARALTGAASLICAWIFVCVLAGVLTGIHGSEPVEMYDISGNEPLDVLELYADHWKDIGTETLGYLYSPVRLFEDLAAWNSGGWLTLAVAGFMAQLGLPQFLVRRRRIDHGA
jgi:hypothetical protein